jgi:putative ABC transport system permease protein
MLFFHVKLALLSLRRTPWTSLICILTIGLGVGVSTSMAAVHHIFSRNPLPEKSDVLFNVRVDTWDPNTEFFDVEPGEPPKSVTYMDMAGLMGADIPTHDTGVANANVYVFPDDGKNEAYQTTVQLCHTGFFPMFNVPFEHGSGWTREMEDQKEPVAVISQRANDKLFGGENSVGEVMRLGTRRFTIIGVLAEWRPVPKFYDPVNSFSGDVREFFIPFEFIRDQDMGLSITGNTDGWGNGSFQGDELFTASEYYWIQYWAEVGPARQAEYVAWVDDYTRELKTLGRHPRPLNNRVSPMMEWIDQRNRAGGITTVVMIISFLFLGVCALNLLGLLLGKFLAKSALIGVHRALGASRAAIFFQHILECELVGVIGGAAGIVLAIQALKLIDRIVPDAASTSSFLVLDGTMAVVAVVLSLAAGLVAGLYPAWRACRIAPAMQLKLQ